MPLYIIYYILIRWDGDPHLDASLGQESSQSSQLYNYYIIIWYWEWSSSKLQINIWMKHIFSWQSIDICTYYICVTRAAGQIITTSAEVTLSCGLVRESPQNPLNSGLGIILICPDGRWSNMFSFRKPLELDKFGAFVFLEVLKFPFKLCLVGNFPPGNLVMCYPPWN